MVAQIPIGGYFELERCPGDMDLNPFYCFQSARGAFYAFLAHVNPNKVWMPRHLCDSMIEVAIAIGVPIGWYDLNQDFSVKEFPALKEDEYFVYVNYFGVCQKSVDNVLAKYGSDRVLIDNCQAFFAKPIEGTHALYSPRKFFGVPDGGLLDTELEIELPEEIDRDSLHRSNHLLARLALGPEGGFEAYQKAERSLTESTPKQMSSLTRSLLEGINLSSIRKKRAENFEYLMSELSEINNFNVDATSPSPMFYPFKGRAILREELLEAKIFIPTYWKDAQKRCEANWNVEMIEGLLPLPLDQRYTPAQLARVVNIVRKR